MLTSRTFVDLTYHRQFNIKERRACVSRLQGLGFRPRAFYRAPFPPCSDWCCSTVLSLEQGAGNHHVLNGSQAPVGPCHKCWADGCTQEHEQRHRHPQEVAPTPEPAGAQTQLAPSRSVAAHHLFANKFAARLLVLALVFVYCIFKPLLGVS